MVQFSLFKTILFLFIFWSLVWHFYEVYPVARINAAECLNICNDVELKEYWFWRYIQYIYIYICLFLSVQLWMWNVWPQLTMLVWDAHSNRVKEQHCSFLSFISHTSFCAGLMVVMKFADNVCVLSTFVFEWSLTLIELLCVSLKEKWLSICNTEHTIHTQHLTHSDQLQKSDTKLN